MTAPEEAAPEPPPLDGPPLGASDPRELLLGYLDWYREALHRKTAGLTEEQLRTPVAGLGWPPLGLVKHLGWVERRWLQWGFLALAVPARHPDGDDAEWRVDPGETPADVWAFHEAQVRASRDAVAGAAWDQRAAVGGRFPTPELAPSLGRILAHLLQEYARHLGHLDAARQLVDGRTGE